MRSNKKEKQENKIERKEEQAWLDYIKKNTGKIRSTEAFLGSIIKFRRQGAN